jgi:hypothetical protein
MKQWVISNHNIKMKYYTKIINDSVILKYQAHFSVFRVRNFIVQIVFLNGRDLMLNMVVFRTLRAKHFSRRYE